MVLDAWRMMDWFQAMEGSENDVMLLLFDLSKSNA